MISSVNSFIKSVLERELDPGHLEAQASSIPMPAASSSSRAEWTPIRKKVSRIAAPSAEGILTSSSPEEAVKKLQAFYRFAGKIESLQRHLRESVPPENPKDLVAFLSIAQAIAASPTCVFGKHRMQSLINDFYRTQLINAYSRSDFVLYLLNHEQKWLLEFFAENGWDVNAPLSSKGHTPLHFACSSGNREMVSWLLEHHANIHLSCKKKYTPLHFAVINGNPSVVALLLEKGANANAHNSELDTPLHMACDRSNLAVTQLLLNAGACPNAVNDEGYVPLHYTFKCTDLNLLLLLLKNGAKPHIQSRHGDTPLALFIESGPVALLAELFSQHPAVISVLEDGEPDKFNRLIKKADNYIQTSQSTPLEIPYLLGNFQLAKELAKRMSKEDYLTGIEHIRTKFPEANVDLLYDAMTELTQSHILESGELLAIRPPESMEMDEWENTLGEIEVGQLLVMFDEINFEHSDQPGYIDPVSIVDANRDHYTVEQLTDKLKEFFTDLENHVPKTGTPKIPSGDPQGDLLEIKEALSANISDQDQKDKLITLLNALIDYYDLEKKAVPIDQPASDLLAMIENLRATPLAPDLLDKLTDLCHAAKALNIWYQHLNKTVKAILYHVKEKSTEEKSDTNPTPYALTVIELALAGGLCGTRYLNDATYIYSQLAGDFPTLRNQILRRLQQLHHRIAQSLVNFDHVQNVHILNRILQIIDEGAGITDAAKRRRFYFNDISAPSQLDAVQVNKRFNDGYYPASVIDEIESAINGPGASIDKDLVIDWFKENLPQDWEMAKYTQIAQEVTGMSKSVAAEYLRENHDIWVSETQTIPQQLETERVFNYLEKKVVDPKTGKITHTAMIYLLENLGVLSCDDDG